MSSQKAVPEEVGRWVRAWIETWLVEHPHDNATALAEHLGVTKAQVSDIRNKGRGVGYKTAVGVARVLGLQLEELFARAKREAPPPEITLEPEDRYPARAEAIRAVKAHVAPEAVLEVRGLNYYGAEGKDVLWWIAQLTATHERLQAQRADPEGAARAQAEQDARSKEKTAAHIAQGEADRAALGPPGHDPFTMPPPKKTKRKR